MVVSLTTGTVLQDPSWQRVKPDGFPEHMLMPLNVTADGKATTDRDVVELAYDMVGDVGIVAGEIWVSPAGNDGNDGSHASPVLTIHQACRVDLPTRVYVMP